MLLVSSEIELRGPRNSTLGVLRVASRSLIRIASPVDHSVGRILRTNRAHAMRAERAERVAVNGRDLFADA